MDELNERLSRLIDRAITSEVYRLLFETSDTALVQRVLKHLMLESFSFNPIIVQACFTAISRFPSNLDLIRPLLKHNLEEVPHCEMALTDFVALGGDEAWARARRISPQAFSMAATCTMLAEAVSPFSYLGFMYLFEASTPVFAQKTMPRLAELGIPPSAMAFLQEHATIDVKHAKLFRTLVLRTMRLYPDSTEPILYGADCFSAVYPIPIWEEAFRRACDERNGSALGTPDSVTQGSVILRKFGAGSGLR